MWYAGMRGAVSFALAITLDDSGSMTAEEESWIKPMVTTTLAVVLITNLAMAPLTKPLLRSLKLAADQQRCHSVSMMRDTDRNTSLHTPLHIPSRVSNYQTPRGTQAVTWQSHGNHMVITWQSVAIT